jgi:nifR3 family TIM-barrel protein
MSRKTNQPCSFSIICINTLETYLHKFCASLKRVFELPHKYADRVSKPICIGDIELPNRAFLAPMSGVTDLPFRKLAHGYGAGLVVSEMVASQAFIEGEAEMQLKVLSGDISPHMVQLAGREAQWMARAAEVAEASGADIIDINMGCPAKRVTTGYSGSALMRDLDHALTLIDAVVNAVSVPVTLKMRLGWDDNSLNAPELAKRAEDAGVQMITVHGRTRCQFYKGKANWDAVRKVREQTGLPLVVNGDIQNHDTANQALEKSGADAIMCGRGAYGSPWLPAQLAGAITNEDAEKLNSNCDKVIEHHEDMLSFYGIESGIRQARKHLGWYLDNLILPASTRSLKKTVLTSFQPSEIHENLKLIYGQHNPISDEESVAA